MIVGGLGKLSVAPVLLIGTDLRSDVPISVPCPVKEIEASLLVEEYIKGPIADVLAAPDSSV